MTQREVDEVGGIDVVAAVRTHGRQAMLTALTGALVVAVIGAVYAAVFQPMRTMSVLEFRPTFEGAENWEYPNGLRFGTGDIVAVPILDLVYDANSISEYCSRELFRGGLFVEQRSDQSAFLDAEFQARLSDTRLTQVDRQLLQAEYEARRQALPIQFRLVFVRPRSCAAIPEVVVAKVMNDVLATWASESEAKRGVLSQQIEVVTPATLDIGVGNEGSMLLRADLIRTSLWRVIESLDAVRMVPGAALVRYGEGQLTFFEVRNKLLDLVRSRLEPIVAAAGQAMARESVAWVTEAVAAAEREQQAAEGRVSANREALQLYSGMLEVPSPARSPGPTSGGTARDVQTLSAQIDSTFIDRIVELSEANIKFRQELTLAMVQAGTGVVAAQERAAYYRRLLDVLRGSAGPQLSQADVDARLAEIVEQGKDLTRQFNELYAEFSRVSLRAETGLYRTVKPAATETSRSVGLGQLLLWIGTTFFITFLLTFGFLVARERFRADPQAP
jgi:hypothetical protein